MIIKNFMTKEVITIKPKTTVEKALKIMKESKFHHLPVLDDGNIEGIVTERDLLHVISYWNETSEESEKDRATLDVKVKKIMTRDVITISENDNIEKALDIMLKKSVGSILVIGEKNKLIGIITITDMLKALKNIINAKAKTNF